MTRDNIVHFDSKSCFTSNEISLIKDFILKFIDTEFKDIIKESVSFISSNMPNNNTCENIDDCTESLYESFLNIKYKKTKYPQRFITRFIFDKNMKSLRAALRSLVRDYVGSILFGIKQKNIESCDGSFIHTLKGFYSKYKRFPTSDDTIKIVTPNKPLMFVYETPDCINIGMYLDTLL